MLYHLRGEIAHIEPHLVVVDVGGVGYGCHTSLQTLSSLTVGEVHTLYVQEIANKDNVIEIYGFLSQGELSSFRMLITVTSLGPKKALAVLSSMTPERLAMAILTGDEVSLSQVPGISKKLSSRIVLELQDKLGKVSGKGEVGMSAALQPGSPLQEALAALQVLGFPATQAAAALEGLDGQGHSTETLIRLALKSLGKQ